VSLAGKWKVTIVSPLGPRHCIWEFVEDGQAWRGNMIGRGLIRDSALTSIVVKDGTVTFQTETYGGPFGMIAFTFEGAFNDLTIEGMSISVYGSTPFSAVRA
jgi:hypothetical protein